MNVKRKKSVAKNKIHIQYRRKKKCSHTRTEASDAVLPMYILYLYKKIIIRFLGGYPVCFIACVYLDTRQLRNCSAGATYLSLDFIDKSGLRNIGMYSNSFDLRIRILLLFPFARLTSLLTRPAFIYEPTFFCFK